MRRPGRFFGWLTAAVLVGWALSWALPRLPRTLAAVDWFRVRTVHVEWHAEMRRAGASERDCGAIKSAFLYDGLFYKNAG